MNQFPWENITLAHWDWTFTILSVGGGDSMSRRFLASFSMKKASPSPSGAWLSEPLTILMVFYVGCTVLLPEPVLEVGPHDLSASFGPFEFCAVNSGTVFTTAIYRSDGMAHFFYH
jgi:hypothetical protein